MLCKMCLKIGLPHPRPPKNEGFAAHRCIVRHHKTFSELILSAQSGCDICSLFRPFVEHQQLRDAGQVKVSRSDCSASGNSEKVLMEDPFLSESSDPTVSDFDSKSEVESSDIGPEEGSSSDGSEHGGAAPSGEQKYPFITDPVTEVVERNGTLEWIIFSGNEITGPEQLWLSIESDRRYSFTTLSNNALATLTLSAGSVVTYDLSDNSCNYCLDGNHIGSRQSMALEQPGLWKHIPKPLHIRAGRKRPLRVLLPIFEYFQNRDNVTQFDPPIEGLSLLENINSEAYFTMIKGWYMRCLTTHPNCLSYQNQPTSELPSRVVDVGPRDLPLSPCLYTATGTHTRGRYAILSHCWGPNTSIISKTTKANLDSHHLGLDVSTLAKTFIEAIELTRGIGIRYLWIDSLCIVQDSAADWATESGKMAQYYKNAELTISGLASPSAQSGLFQLRCPAESARLSTHCGEVFIRPQLDDIASILGGLSPSSRPRVSYMPLNERAWTLQERVLSTRILNFTKQQLVWQCKTCVVSEDGQYSSTFGADPAMGDESKEKSEGKKSSAVGRTIIDLVDFSRRNRAQGALTVRDTGWHALLEEYSQRKMTYATDKLPAIGGLASEVAQLTQDRYLAGLWQRQLRDELLWNSWGDPESFGWTKPTRIAAYNNNSPPSWSWASLDGWVRNEIHNHRHTPRKKIDPEILKSWSRPVNQGDPFGMVRSAGIVVSAMCHEYTGPFTFVKSKPTEPQQTQDSDIEISDSSSEEGSDAGWSEYKDAVLDEMYLDLKESKLDTVGVRYLLAFFGEYVLEQDPKVRTFVEKADKYRHQRFLLLRRAPDRRTRCYSRVGAPKSSTFPREWLKITKSNGWTRRRLVLI